MLKKITDGAQHGQNLFDALSDICRGIGSIVKGFQGLASLFRQETTNSEE